MRENVLFNSIIFSLIVIMSGCATKEISIGAKLKLFGGYDQTPIWLVGKDFHLGTVERYITGQNETNAMVVRLDSPLSVEGVTGDLVVLELRCVGEKWVDEGVLHVELCGFESEDKSWKNRKQGAWVESHASYKTM